MAEGKSAEFIKETVMVHMTHRMKEALGAYTTAHQVSMQEFIRQLIAPAIKYDYAGEKKVTSAYSPRKYNSAQEREDAQKKRAKEKRELERRLMDEYKAAQKAKAIKALEGSLKH